MSTHTCSWVCSHLGRDAFIWFCFYWILIAIVCVSAVAFISVCAHIHKHSCKLSSWLCLHTSLWVSCLYPDLHSDSRLHFYLHVCAHGCIYYICIRLECFWFHSCFYLQRTPMHPDSQYLYSIIYLHSWQWFYLYSCVLMFISVVLDPLVLCSCSVAFYICVTLYLQTYLCWCFADAHSCWCSHVYQYSHSFYRQHTFIFVSMFWHTFTYLSTFVFVFNSCWQCCTFGVAFILFRIDVVILLTFHLYIYSHVPHLVHMAMFMLYWFLFSSSMCIFIYKICACSCSCLHSCSRSYLLMFCVTSMSEYTQVYFLVFVFTQSHIYISYSCF